MKGYRFYLEYPSKTEKNKATVKRPGNHEGNCIAVPLSNGGGLLYGGDWSIETFSAVYKEPNSDCCGSQASLGYLRERCKRIPERLAREIHPKLFSYLEQ